MKGTLTEHVDDNVLKAVRECRETGEREVGMEDWES